MNDRKVLQCINLLRTAIWHGWCGRQKEVYDTLINLDDVLKAMPDIPTAKEPATEAEHNGVCPNCRAILGVPDSVRTYKDGRVRMYWECCGISVMSPAKAVALDARFQQQPPAMTEAKDDRTVTLTIAELKAGQASARQSQLAELRGRASRLINRSIESGYYSENSRLVLDDFANQLLGGANGTG